MASIRSRTNPTRTPATVFVSGVAALLLAGCAVSDTPGAGTGDSPSPSSSATLEASTSPVAEPTSDESATPDTSDIAVISEPTGLDCSTVLTAEQMYAYPGGGQNFSLLEGDQPESGTGAARVTGMQGLTCHWVNATSEEPLDIGVAKLPPEQLEGLANLAWNDSHAVSFTGDPAVEGYFVVRDSDGNDVTQRMDTSPVSPVGEAQIFTGSYWITISSSIFFEQGDVQPLVEDILANLPVG